MDCWPCDGLEWPTSTLGNVMPSSTMRVGVILYLVLVLVLRVRYSKDYEVPKD